MPTIFSTVKDSALNALNSVTFTHCFQCCKSQCSESTEFSNLCSLFPVQQKAVLWNSVMRHWIQCYWSSVFSASIVSAIEFSKKKTLNSVQTVQKALKTVPEEHLFLGLGGVSRDLRESPVRSGTCVLTILSWMLSLHRVTHQCQDTNW